MSGAEAVASSACTRRIVVRSVGTARAGIVGALHHALPFPEERLAACVYQAPAELIGPIDEAVAQPVAEALGRVGLVVDVLGVDEPFTPGGPDYDVALVIKRFDRLVDVAEEIAAFLGVNAERARQMLCACPAELIGKVSANTVDAIRSRFEPLGVSVIASRRESAVFDIFCPESHRDQVRRILCETGSLPNRSESPAQFVSCVASGLDRQAAEGAWQRMRGASIPLRILNRDFQRFDVRLDQAADTQETVAFLVESADMPERIARRIPARTPIFTHHDVQRQEALDLLDRIARLGGRATAHVLALQSFRLQLARVGDADSTVRLLEVLGGADAAQARAAVRSMATVNRPATAHQARWLQHELKRVGTEVRMFMA
jgi:hypothetical protein